MEVGDGGRKIPQLGSIKNCVHHLFLLMMIQIIICTRGTDNRDMALCFIWEVLGEAVYGRCPQRKKAPLPGEEVPDFTGIHRVLQCCTLSGVISHKASLILHQEQLRGLWSEIKRCTIHFLHITSLIIHLNCSERLSRAKCQARCWLGMCRHVHVKGWAEGRGVGARKSISVSACDREAGYKQHEHHEQVCGNSSTLSCVLKVVNLGYTALSCKLFSTILKCEFIWD